MKTPHPVGRPPFGLLLFVLLIFAALFETAACGGGASSTTGGGGGGGGGGGQNAPPCIFNAPNAGGSTTSVGTTAQISQKYFGMHLNSPNAPWPFFPFGGQRLWAAGVSWAQINTAANTYDWSLFDQWMSEAQPHGVDIVYTLARTPQWASQQPSDSSCSSGPGECDPPLDLNKDGSGTDATWISWVSAIAQHSLSDKNSGLPGISYYEIWNEWNSNVYWNPQYGTTAQLVRMEEDARCVVEGAPSGLSCTKNASVFPQGTALDPNAKIVSPSPVGAAADGMLGEVAASLTTYFSTSVSGYAGGTFSDEIGFHGYVGTGTKGNTGGGSPLPCPVAENVNTVISDMSQTLNSYPDSASSGGSLKPLFDTEAGWSEAPVEGFTDLERQAAFLPRYLLLQASSNISRVYWFAWDSKTDSSLYNDTTGQTTPAATAYQQVNTWTVGATVSKTCSATGTVWTCGFSRSGGYSALAVWDAGQDCTTSNCPTTTFTVPAGGYTEYLDVAGDPATTLNGASSVQIGAKPILLETGPIP
ncbi:MAG: hypothetical protein WAM79_11240 [Candidatus Sulfotelmatobacter sp.]